MTDFPKLRAKVTDSDVFPIVVQDTREQCPLPFTRLRRVIGTLTTGDYSIAGLEHLFAVERKSIADLTGCCLSHTNEARDNRARFERELHRLRGFRFKRLLVVGSRKDIEAGEYRSEINPKSVLHTLDAFEARYDVPVVFSATPESAGQLIEMWAFWFARDVVGTANEVVKAAGKEGTQQQ